jgi:hypothetical protein
MLENTLLETWISCRKNKKNAIYASALDVSFIRFTGENSEREYTMINLNKVNL